MHKYYFWCTLTESRSFVMIINLQKKTLVLIILICSAAVTFAQQDESQVQVVYPETPNLYAEADNATIKLISNIPLSDSSPIT